MAYYRTCPRCGHQKSHTTEKGRNLAIRNNSHCRQCTGALKRYSPEKLKASKKTILETFKKKHGPEAIKRMYQHRSLMTLYGLSLSEYEEMLKLQNDACNICKTPAINFKYRLCVDHNHESGKVRGLLCNDCNRALGYFKDDLSRVSNAVQHLSQDLTNANQLTDEQRKRHQR